MFTKPEEVLAFIKSEGVTFVDVRFCDLPGVMQHFTVPAAAVDADFFSKGVAFDGSSIRGFQAIHESDMGLIPDVTSAYIDPFRVEKTLNINFGIVDPYTAEPYSRDPRQVAAKAEAYLRSTGIADQAFFGPEAEFYVFDSIRYATSAGSAYHYIDSIEAAWNSGREEEGGNLGHKIGYKGGYFPVPPVDQFADLRDEMVVELEKLDFGIERAHHEVGTAGQAEINYKFDTLLKAGDKLQLFKYVIKGVAHANGRTATFMPKPLFGDNGSGMHCHQSLWKDGKPLFAGNLYADLSELCLFYIGGIIKHAKALNAFTNPTTNSYKRLVPGYEAPVLLAYSARNRSASCRIPYTTSPKAKRVEVRFPDPMANPYLAFAAMLMAGLDGIKNKIDPGPAMDKDLYDLPKEELKQIPTVCGSLREALENLDKDRAFLKAGGVFDDDFIDAYIELKMTDVMRFEMTPHPVEFDMYYSY